MAGKRRKQAKQGNGLRRVTGVAVLTAFAFLLTSGAPVGTMAASAGSPAREAAPLVKRRAPLPIPAEQTPVVPTGILVDDRYFDDVVFIGDSRTQGLQLYSGMKNGRFLCAVGATAESVFSKNTEETAWGKVPILDALAAMDCGKVYIMLGINELGWPNPDSFREQYSKLIDRIREDHPDIVVVIESLLPVSALQEAKGSYVNNERIVQYNEILLELAAEKECPYLNVAEAVSDENGCLQADWNFDGVHLNPAGCRAWRNYLETHPVGPYDPDSYDDADDTDNDAAAESDISTAETDIEQPVENHWTPPADSAPQNQWTSTADDAPADDWTDTEDTSWTDDAADDMDTAADDADIGDSWSDDTEEVPADEDWSTADNNGDWTEDIETSETP